MVRQHNEPPNISEPTPRPTWEALKHTRPNLQPEPDWARHRVPQELQDVVDDSVLPQKLRQILVWSLIIDSTSSVVRAKTSTLRRDTTRMNGCIRRGTIQENSNNSPMLTEQRVGDKANTSPVGDVNDRTSLSQTAHSDYFPEELRLRSQTASNRLFASTFGLLTALKSKAAGPLSAPADIPADTPKSPEAKASTVECTSCFDDTPQTEARKLPCNHSYCRPCLTTLITTALQNESNFPPKCCLTKVPLQTILSVLDVKQTTTYKDKAAEYSIPAQERWYCPNAKCLKWIRPSKLPRIPAWNERCPHCATKMCTICRGLAHKSSSDCPQDFGMAAMMNLAEEEGWRRCVKCRTLVERSQGCRHMTCKCGAQFCYTCGKKWRTCSCTETDEVNRQANLRRRRGEREGARDEEAAEVARIIAQIEEVERATARQGRLAEERQAEEQRREEAELARLEQQRLREEQTRRVEELRLEQLLQSVLRVSVRDTNEALRLTLNDVRQTQMRSIDSRHMDAEQRHACARDEAITQRAEQNFENVRNLESNVERRTMMMQERHELRKVAFHAEQQNLEDEMFLEIKTHLHGKEDSELREQRLREQFKSQRADKYQDLLSKNDLEAKAFQATATMEMQSLKWTNRYKVDEIEPKFRQNFIKLSSEVAADRAWFDFIFDRRQDMLAAHNRLMLDDLDAGQEPTGLTEEIAMTIRPLPAELREQAARLAVAARGEDSGSIQNSPTESTSPTELATTSKQFPTGFEEFPMLAESERAPGSPRSRRISSADDALLLNSAFAWMTGAIEEGVPQANINRSSGLSRTRRVSRHDRPNPRTSQSLASPSTPSPSGWLQPEQVLALSPSSMDPLSITSPSLTIQKSFIPPTSPTTLHGSKTKTNNSLGSTTPVPKLIIPPRPPYDRQLAVEQSISGIHQSRVLGGLVPTSPQEEANRLKQLNNLIFRRQASTTFVGSSSSSSSSSDSLPISSMVRSIAPSASIAKTPSPRSSVTSRSSGDGFFLHSLISAATNTATAAAGPSNANLSPVRYPVRLSQLLEG